MSITPSEKTCTGCTACSEICPKGAIHMSTNSHGFLIPEINYNNCIDCNLCFRVCPQINESNLCNSFVQAYAFKSTNDEIRRNSTSGGLFFVLAKMVLESGGFVCGCVLEDLKPIHIITNKIVDVERMQGSKYVQSELGSCFEEIKRLLSDGESVLFSGTSCQVSGLLSFLSQKKNPTTRLLCVDLICHGVPSPLLWNDYINYYEKKLRHKVIDYKFRNKKYGWGKSSLGGDYLSYSIYENNGKQKMDDRSLLVRLWRTLFLSNNCLRSVCYECKYASLNKPGDITMGDFWGIDVIDPLFDDGKGCSLALINSPKGQEAIFNLKECEFKSVSIGESIKKQPNLQTSSAANQTSSAFWDDYSKFGFEYVLKKYYKYNCQQRIKGKIKRILFDLRLRYLF